MSVYRKRPRIVFSMTTIPSRLLLIEPIIYGIMRKLKHCDALYLNLPHVSRKGIKYVIPINFLSSLPEKHRSKVIINRCIDYGPITKIIPTFMKENGPKTVIVSIDDDIIMKQDVSSILLEKHEMYPNACLSFSGFCAGKFPFYGQFTSGSNKDLEVAWIQGIHCILYPRRLINTKELLDFKPYMLKHDDHRINGYLASKGIKRISIGAKAKDYLKDDPSIQCTESISGNFDFVIENFKICRQFRAEGYYLESNSCSYYTSITGLILLAAFLIAATMIANSTWKGHDFLFIVIFSIILGALLAWAIVDGML